jgi:hypothetical protein
VWVGPQAEGRFSWKCSIRRQGRTNYSSQRACCKVFPAVELNLRPWEGLLECRHLCGRSNFPALLGFVRSSYRNLDQQLQSTRYGQPRYRTLSTKKNKALRGEYGKRVRKYLQEDLVFINVFCTDVTVVVCWCRSFLDKRPRDNRHAGVASGYVIGIHGAVVPDADADYASCITRASLTGFTLA